MWVYRKIEKTGGYVYSVGFYAPPIGVFGYMPGGHLPKTQCEWVTTTEFLNETDAICRVNFLNGGSTSSGM